MQRGGQLPECNDEVVVHIPNREQPVEINFKTIFTITVHRIHMGGNSAVGMGMWAEIDQEAAAIIEDRLFGEGAL